MSVVACRINEKDIEISSDSIIVYGITQEKGKDKFSKLVQVNDLVIGCCGSAGEGGLLQIFALTHKPLGPTERDVLIFMSEFAEWKKKQTDKYELENQYIIIANGHAFEFESFFIREITKFHAIGAGRDFALATMHLGNDTIKAVDTACELCVYCEKPIVTFRVERK